MTPDPFGAVPPQHTPHWQDSALFVMHRPAPPSDVLILRIARHPRRGTVDGRLMGRVGEHPVSASFTERLVDGQHSGSAGPISFQPGPASGMVRLRAQTTAAVRPLTLDATFRPRTQALTLPRGSLSVDGDLVWDQQHAIQSGWFDGSYTFGAQTLPLRGWVGQRDRSWGVRRHRRCPFWMWLAIQLGDGMLGAWCWEKPDGTRVYAEGWWAPAASGEAVRVSDIEHDLFWVDEQARVAPDDRAAAGLIGTVRLRLADGSCLALHGNASWAARYGPLGGGQLLMDVTTGDGRRGCGIVELTGSAHHRYFPARRPG